MTLRNGGILGVVLIMLVLKLPFAAGQSPDESPQPLPKKDSPTAAATQPSKSATESEYREAVRAARVTYCQAMVAADEKLLARIDTDRKAAKQAGNDAEVERLDRRSESAVTRLREDQALLAAAQAREPARIVSAKFGRANKWADVTDLVKGFAQSPEAVRANAGTLAVDPDPGWNKRLEIVYIQDGERRTAMFDTDREIRIPGLIPLETESR